VKGSRKKLKVLFEKNLFFFLTLIFISMNNNRWFVLDVMNLMKKFSLHFESIVYCFKLLACLIRKDLYRHVT